MLATTQTMPSVYVTRRPTVSESHPPPTLPTIEARPTTLATEAATSAGSPGRGHPVAPRVRPLVDGEHRGSEAAEKRGRAHEPERARTERLARRRVPSGHALARSLAPEPPCRRLGGRVADEPPRHRGRPDADHEGGAAE